MPLKIGKVYNYFIFNKVSIRFTDSANFGPQLYQLANFEG